ncbi:MAG: hypothetical protein LBC67_03340 [Spirochaetales bacterium]|jgi:hypothetical protein|nr:hypothetical protein [Spirochaetales bacterium]
MAEMTEAEADALDELWTKTTPKVSGDGTSGFFMKHKGNLVVLDDLSAAWLRARSDALHKTPTELIGEMVREKIAALG